MAVKMVPFSTRCNGQADCMILRMNKSYDGKLGVIEMSFPFHEDTPNFILTLSEAMDLRNAIDEAYGIMLVEGRSK